MQFNQAKEITRQYGLDLQCCSKKLHISHITDSDTFRVNITCSGCPRDIFCVGIARDIEARLNSLHSISKEAQRND